MDTAALPSYEILSLRQGELIEDAGLCSLRSSPLSPSYRLLRLKRRGLEHASLPAPLTPLIPPVAFVAACYRPVLPAVSTTPLGGLCGVFPRA